MSDKAKVVNMPRKINWDQVLKDKQRISKRKQKLVDKMPDITEEELKELNALIKESIQLSRLGLPHIGEV